MADLDEFRPFDSGIGKVNNEAQLRELFRGMADNGVDFGFANGFSVYGDSSGRQVKVRTGRAWVDGHYGESTSEKTIPLTTNTSGNPRIDRIVLRVSPTENKISIEVVVGTPAATPSAPALTQSPTGVYEITLAQVAIANGYSTVAAGDVTDERTLYTNSPRLFTPPYCELTRTASQTITHDAATKVTWDSEVADTDGMHSTSSNTSRITIQRAGIYLVSAYIRWENNPYSNVRVEVFINNSATLTAEKHTNMSGTETPRVQVAGVAKLAAGDYLEVEVQHVNTGTSSRNISQNSKFSACYLGAYS